MTARKLAGQALADPKSVDHDVAAVALEVSARNGDEAFYNQVLEHLKNAKNPEAVYVYRQTLSDFTDPKLLQRTLDYVLSTEVRSQDAPLVLGRMVRNPEESRMAWDFARAHWAEISKMGGAFGSGAITEAAAAFCDPQLESEVKDFFAAHPVPSAERTLKQSLESIGQCIDMKTRQAPQLATWLGQQSSVAGQ